MLLSAYSVFEHFVLAQEDNLNPLAVNLFTFKKKKKKKGPHPETTQQIIK